MKSVVIYRSKTGFSKKYAYWIAEAINAQVMKVKKVNINDLLQYDNIIYCGGIYASRIFGFNFIKKNFNKIKNKNIVAVAVGATIKKEEAIEEIKGKNLTAEMKGKVDFFLLRGGIDYKRMHLFDKLLMFLLIKSIKVSKKDETNPEAKGMIENFGKTVDFTNKESIKPIVDCINSKSN